MAPRSVLVLLVFSLSACGLRSFDPREASAEDEAAALSVTFEPLSAEGEVATVVRAIVTSTGPIDPARLRWFSGSLGSGHAGQLERDELSSALEERILPTLSFEDADGRTVVAPLVLFEPGEDYALGSGAPAFTRNVTALPSHAVLARVWPPREEAATAQLAIHCGEQALPPLAREVLLAPSGVLARLSRGAVSGVGQRCVRIDVLGDAAEPPLPPLSLEIDGELALFEPAPLAAVSESPSPVVALPCAAGEVPFGPGCALVDDDRLRVKAPETALFWAISAPAFDHGQVVAAGAWFSIAPLVPESSIVFRVTTLDAAGQADTAVVGVTTRAPMPHFVLSEVLANPLGAEPAQEFVELVNDGLAPGDLAGFALEDGGGVTLLPSALVPPGGLLLLVPETFVEDDGIDPPPALGTTLVRVEKLGKNGLANGGEPLALRAPDGRVVSRVPPLPKPAAGQSLARRVLASPDDGPDAFVRGAPTPGTVPNE
jgi:hypothetical protein